MNAYKKPYNIRPTVKRPQRTSLKRQSIPYSGAVAFSLVKYAHANAAFAAYLEDLAFALPRYGEDRPARAVPQGTRLLVPYDHASAGRKTHWLLERIEHRDLPGTEEAARILSGWARERPWPGPRHLVVGMIQVAIPFITLGKLGMRRERMPVILESRRAAKRDLNLVRNVHTATSGVIAKSVARAHGNVRKLEPEVADWFFGERALSLYQGTAEDMEALQIELAEIGVLYSTVGRGGTTKVLALSPGAHLSADTHPQIEALEA